MTAAKTYLNVPYAQKEAAKALGARWDPANKKWYVPAGKDLAPFSPWTVDAGLPGDIRTVSKKTTPSNPSSSNNASTGVFTYPANSDFVAYSGDEPPWD